MSSAPQLENPLNGHWNRKMLGDLPLHSTAMFDFQNKSDAILNQILTSWSDYPADLPAQLKHGDVGLRLRILERGAKKTAPKYWIILDLQIFWDSRKLSKRDLKGTSSHPLSVAPTSKAERQESLDPTLQLVQSWWLVGEPLKKNNNRRGHRT